MSENQTPQQRERTENNGTAAVVEEEYDRHHHDDRNEEEISLFDNDDVDDDDGNNNNNSHSSSNTNDDADDDGDGEETNANNYSNNNDADDDAGDALSRMTPSQRRLMQLRMKMSSARRENMEEVFHEKRAMEKMSIQMQQQQRKWKTRRELREEALDVNITAETAEWINETRKRKEGRERPEGHDLFTNDAMYRSMDRRITEALRADGKSVKRRRKARSVGTGEEMEEGLAVATTLGSDRLTFGQSEGPGDVDRMVADLHRQQERRDKFHRRRTFVEDKDVDYINERNRRTNLRLEKDYGKYTKEIKRNLERGTA